MKLTFEELNEKVIHCVRCPRLVAFRENVAPRKAFENEPHWRRPVPGFGDPNASLLILGIAPAPQGGNRTGRVFTGDESGRFLFPALYEAGYANQPTGESISDGLTLIDCYITAAVKCVPPKHKPLPEEFFNCSEYFENEFFLLKNLKAVLALGKIAFDTYLRFLKKEGVISHLFPFTHGATVEIPGWPTLYGSYHPTPQNTYTKRLTHKMLVDLLKRIKSKYS